jgi:c-di-GMP-binding flagellar brake protein YcgR
VTFTGDAAGAGTIANLSIQGCGIETDAVPPQGAILHLTLHETTGQPAIEVEAAVVRAVAPRLRQVGVEFLRLQAGEQEKLRRVIETHWRGL